MLSARPRCLDLVFGSIVKILIVVAELSLSLSLDWSLVLHLHLLNQLSCLGLGTVWWFQPAGVFWNISLSMLLVAGVFEALPWWLASALSTGPASEQQVRTCCARKQEPNRREADHARDRRRQDAPRVPRFTDSVGHRALAAGSDVVMGDTAGG